MYAWENSFISKILTIRDREVKILRKIAIVSSFVILFTIHSPFFVSHIRK